MNNVREISSTAIVESPYRLSAALEQAVEKVKIYAGVSPEDKLRIVKARRMNGNVTAMTGAGVYHVGVLPVISCL